MRTYLEPGTERTGPSSQKCCRPRKCIYRSSLTKGSWISWCPNFITKLIPHWIKVEKWWAVNVRKNNLWYTEGLAKMGSGVARLYKKYRRNRIHRKSYLQALKQYKKGIKKSKEIVLAKIPGIPQGYRTSSKVFEGYLFSGEDQTYVFEKNRHDPN